MSAATQAGSQLSLVWSAKSADNFTIFAPTDYGFFGLSELKAFTKDFQPYAKRDAETVFLFDFSAVKMWDISALLWLTVGLHHYRHQYGLRFRLRLPDENTATHDKDAFWRSADYLRRWEFNVALQNIDADAEGLLVSEQRGYFGDGPTKYYQDRKIKDESNILQSLISRRLVQIRNLTDPNFLGAAPMSAVSPAKISQCVRTFQAARIGDILVTQCGIEQRKADLFADQMLTEALMNVLEHPNATIGLVSLSVMGKSKELILTVADNGDSIADTIHSRYKADHPLEAHSVSLPEAFESRGRIIDYATQAGVTSKQGALAAGAGMGLCYIKEDTVGKFHGKLQILSSGVVVKYGPGVDQKIIDDWPHPWKGNLLRLAIPLASIQK